MEQNMSVETSLLNAVRTYVSRRTSVLSVLISVIIAFIGCVSIYFGMDLGLSSGTMSMLLLTVGTIMLLIALYRFFWKAKEWVYILTGSKIIEGFCYMEAGHVKGFQELLDSMKHNGVDVPADRITTNVRLDYLMTEDTQFAAIQLFQFVPYTYEPLSRVYYYSGDNAIMVAQYLKHIRN